MSTIHFISDTHFGHNNIIQYCGRPFGGVEEMDQALVEAWNKQVSPLDTVYHLGDWAFHNYERINELNGKIWSVPGNHDHERMKKLPVHIQAGMLEEVHYLKLDKERRFVLCHYPIESWRREYRFHLHGHTHGIVRKQINRLDVGWDALPAFRPHDIDEIMQLLINGEAPR